MGILDDQIIINENLLKAVKDLIGSMEQAHKCMNRLTERIRELEKIVYQGGNHGKT